MSIIIIVSIIIFVLMVCVVVSRIMSFNNMPIEYCRARVIGKRSSKRGSNGGTSYYVVFEINNQQIEFRTSSTVFYSIIEGEEGLLSYKENYAVEFTKSI